jgi:hypothetical protein
MDSCLRASGMDCPIFHANVLRMLPTNNKPPLDDMSGALKSTRIFLPETISGREKSIFSWLFEDFEVPLHIRSVYKSFWIKHLKVLNFVEMTKKNASFFCLYELFRLE